MKLQTVRPIVHNENGQAVLEYILLLMVMIGAFVTIASFITSSGLAGKLSAPITKDFAHTYQYGNAKTLGFEDGGPKNHPRVTSSGNFRLFINPQ